MGDEDLLEIIGNSKNVGKLQKHFKKMFAGVATLILSDDSQLVRGICSREGEEVSSISLSLLFSSLSSLCTHVCVFVMIHLVLFVAR